MGTHVRIKDFKILKIKNLKKIIKNNKIGRKKKEKSRLLTKSDANILKAISKRPRDQRIVLKIRKC